MASFCADVPLRTYSLSLDCLSLSYRTLQSMVEFRESVLQGVLLAADETVSLAADTGNCVDVTPCHNGTANHDDVEPSSTVSRVRLVQFEKNTSDPLVSDAVARLTCVVCAGDCL